MKRIYTAAHLLEAQLVVDLLEQAGIAAHVFNANAMSALGDLPMSAAWPQVWIVQAHQEPHARAIIAAYQQPRAARSGKVCAVCSEASPGEFELCWNCGAALSLD